MSDRQAPSLDDGEQAALELLRALDAHGYRFTTVTPESHRRVVARASMREAKDLRGVLGWSLPFREELIPGEIFALLKRARFLKESAAGWKATVRVSCVHDLLFLHSAFPTVSDDSVFLGPDTVRFSDFILAELGPDPAVRRMVDIGAGAGVGGIIAARRLARASCELVDINRTALSHARINAAHAGVPARTYESNGVDAVEPGFDLAIANPPFIIDEDGPAYRAGGDMHGAELSRDWTLAAAAKLALGGRVLLYTGSAIVDGGDALRGALEEALPALGCTLRYRELDPDIFGEELGHAAYADVERIAAIGAVVEKRRLNDLEPAHRRSVNLRDIHPGQLTQVEEVRMNSQGQTGTRDETYNIVSVLYHSLQGAETIQQYKQDASSDQQMSQFLDQAQQQYRQLADQAKQLLQSKLGNESQQSGGMSSGGGSMGGGMSESSGGMGGSSSSGMSGGASGGMSGGGSSSGQY